MGERRQAVPQGVAAGRRLASSRTRAAAFDDRELRFLGFDSGGSTSLEFSFSVVDDRGEVATAGAGPFGVSTW